MAADKSTHPRWFIFWRRLVYVATILFILAALYSIPLDLAALQTGQVSDANLSNWIDLIKTILFLVGFVLGIIALPVLFFRNAVLSMQRAPSALAWQHIIRPVLLAIIAFIVFLVIGVVLSPAPEIQFQPIIYTLSAACTFRFQVVAFEDQNSNGLRDPNEPGLPNISLTVSYPDPQLENVSPKYISQSVTTDSNGLAVVSVSYNACPSNATVRGSAKISVQPPPGYTATTLTTFGPLSLAVDWENVGTVQTVYVGFRKAS